VSIQPTHPRWCEPDLCGPLLYDEPDGPRLHQGATVVYDGFGTLHVELVKAGDEPTGVHIGGVTIDPATARRLAGTLSRLADLAESS
jgi:hypothetical protein